MNCPTAGVGFEYRPQRESIGFSGFDSRTTLLLVVRRQAKWGHAARFSGTSIQPQGQNCETLATSLGKIQQVGSSATADVWKRQTSNSQARLETFVVHRKTGRLRRPIVAPLQETFLT